MFCRHCILSLGLGAVSALAWATGEASGLVAGSALIVNLYWVWEA